MPEMPAILCDRKHVESGPLPVLGISDMYHHVSIQLKIRYLYLKQHDLSRHHLYIPVS
jgi:hypothetical protein